MSNYCVGIDLGSTTAKIAVLDENNRLIRSEYTRHGSKVKETIIDMLRGFQDTLEGHMLSVAITGSAGFGIAEPAGSTDSGFAAFISTGASSDSNSRRIRSGSSFAVSSVAPSSASNSSTICVASKSSSSCGAAVLKPSFTTAENTGSDFFEVSATGAPCSKKGFSYIGSSSSAPN